MVVDWDYLPTVRDVDDCGDPWWDYQGVHDPYEDEYPATPIKKPAKNTPKYEDPYYNQGIGIDGTGSWNNALAYSDIQYIVKHDPESAINIICDYYGVNQGGETWNYKKAN